MSNKQIQWKAKLQLSYGKEAFAPSADREKQLYDGFLRELERRLGEQVRTADPAQWGHGQWMFDGPRLPELLFRYRARNFPDTLNGQEQQRWQDFCRQRLLDPQWGAPNTLGDFAKALELAWPGVDAAGQQVLQAWQLHARHLQAQLAIA